jgi:hypothetical protein
MAIFCISGIPGSSPSGSSSSIMVRTSLAASSGRFQIKACTLPSSTPSGSAGPDTGPVRRSCTGGWAASAFRAGGSIRMVLTLGWSDAARSCSTFKDRAGRNGKDGMASTWARVGGAQVSI